MFPNLEFELNDYLIRKHLAKYNYDAGYYDVLMKYHELIDNWDDWVMSVWAGAEFSDDLKTIRNASKLRLRK